MTSPDVSRRRSDGLLDAMIRWVLRERVGDATPPPGVWERIDERLNRPASADGGAWRRGFRLAAEPVAPWLVAVLVVGARAELPHYGLGVGSAWQGDPFYLSDQYEILLRRLAVL